MGRKTIIGILLIMFILSLSAGIYGFLNKDRNNKPVNNKVVLNTIKYANNSIEIEDLESQISTYEFTMANREVVKDNFSVNIEDNKVVLSINSDEESQENKKVEITDVDSVEAILAEEDENGIYVYLMDSSKNLYRSLVDLESYKISTLKYDISNIESFISFYDSLNSENIVSYVIIKTKDGNYYTDYRENSEEELSIKELKNKPLESDLTEDDNKVNNDSEQNVDNNEQNQNENINEENIVTE